MARIIRSAMLQTRVTPEIKYASEHVLHRLGLNMTEAIELFLRRMVIDQRLPFEVIAFDNATYTQLLLDWEEEFSWNNDTAITTGKISDAEPNEAGIK